MVSCSSNLISMFVKHDFQNFVQFASGSWVDLYHTQLRQEMVVNLVYQQNGAVTCSRQQLALTRMLIY